MTMAKRQSFNLEAKPLRTNKPNTDKSNSLSKQCYSRFQICKNYVCYLSLFYFSWLKIPKNATVSYSFLGKTQSKIMLQ